MRAAQVLLLALLPTPGVRADEPKGKLDLLIGKWEVTSSKREPPVGSIIEFGKEGKMKITVKKNGDKETIDGVHKVIANTLHLTYKTGKKEDRKEPITIKRITDLELVLEAEMNLTFELKRIKGCRNRSALGAAEAWGNSRYSRSPSNTQVLSEDSRMIMSHRDRSGRN